MELVTAPITVVVASIPPRAETLLPQALASIGRQTLRPAGGVEVALDADHQGSAVTRNRALAEVQTPWVAFLDDDDEFFPQHLARLWAHQQDTNADYVFSWYYVLGGADPRPHLFGVPFDIDNPHHTTVTVLARTELIRGVGGFVANADIPDSENAVWPLIQAVCERGHEVLGRRPVVSHLPEITWLFRHHGWAQPGQLGNTSGAPWRW